MLKTDLIINPANLSDKINKFWQLSGDKISLIERQYDESQGSPVFTISGKYTTRGWTEWTQGFLYGSALFQYESSGDQWFLDYARRKTIENF